MSFTNNEHAVLRAMYQSMRANGFDFGIVEEIIPACGLSVATARGTLRELRQKVAIESEASGVPNVTQFTVGLGEIDCNTTFEQWVELLKR